MTTTLMKLTFNKTIVEQLAETLNLPIEELRNITQQLESSFNNLQQTAYEGFSTFAKPEAASFFTEMEKEKWEAATLIGFDLPVLIQCEMPLGKRVVIVGIDPLRKRKDFPENEGEHYVIAGTPYAVHSSFYRDKRNRTKVYWDFICGLAKQYDVYVTDVFKLWMNDAAIGEHVKFPFDASLETWKTFLAFEIKTIEPSYIICFGKAATEICRSLSVAHSNCTIIPLLHPSGRNKSWDNVIEGRSTVDAKVRYLLKQMEEAFILGSNQ